MVKKIVGKIKAAPKPTSKAAKDYKIYGVRREEELNPLGDRELPRPLETMLNKGGGCLMIAAAPSSGKSNFLVNLFLRQELMLDLFQGGTYLISPTAQNDLTSKPLVDYFDLVETQYSEELVESLYHMIMNTAKDERALSTLVLDDCLGQIRINSFMNRWASAVRHLRNLLVFSLQACKGIPPTIRSNISHSIVFYQPSSKQLADLVELHSNMGGEETFINAYNEATNEKYGFLLCDFRDMKMYKWGGTLTEPVELWTRYDENGNLNKTSDLNNDTAKEILQDKTDE